MENYFYSPSKNQFLAKSMLDDYKKSGSWPDDAVEVSIDVYQAFGASPAPVGKIMMAGSDGLPCWGDIPLPDIEDARKQKHVEINHWRDIQENGDITFTWNNHSWDASKASQDRLAPVLTVAKSGQLPEGFFWTDANNEDVPVTVDDLTAIDAGMTQAMVAQGFKIHERQRQMKKDIDELTKVGDILNYSVGWPDNHVIK